MTFVSESFHLSGHLTCGIRCWGSIYNFTYFATFRSLPNLRKYEMSTSQNVRHICRPRPAPLSNFGAKAVEFLRKKWAADFLPPWTTADICHSSNGLLYVAANQGFISPGYIEARARGTQCEECQIFGTEVWECHLIVNLSLQTFSKRVWLPKMAQKIGRGEFFLAFKQKLSALFFQNRAILKRILGFVNSWWERYEYCVSLCVEAVS